MNKLIRLKYVILSRILELECYQQHNVVPGCLVDESFPAALAGPLCNQWQAGGDFCFRWGWEGWQCLQGLGGESSMLSAQTRAEKTVFGISIFWVCTSMVLEKDNLLKNIEKKKESSSRQKNLNCRSSFFIFHQNLVYHYILYTCAYMHYSCCSKHWHFWHC